MFEIIGLFVGTAILFVLAAIVGGIYALITWWMLRRRTLRYMPLIIGAGLLPVICVAYMLICEISFSILVPSQSGILLGDINEPLPNGYSLQALEKMPDYANIHSESDEMHQPKMLGYIGRIEVNGPLIYGEYSHVFNQSTMSENDDYGYFVFNTHDKSVRNFQTIQELNSYVGHNVHLIDAQFFRSQEPSHQRLIKIENVVQLYPPAIAFLLYSLLLLRARVRSSRKIKVNSSFTLNVRS